MKKTLLTLTTIIALASCNSVQEKINLIAPEGTPSIALANFYTDNKDSFDKFDIKGGSDPLVAAFTSQDYDIIVAPTNLGAKFYNMNQNYLLYQTIVWGNLYLASKQEIKSFSDLNNKTITYFGGNTATPYIVLNSLITHYNLENVSLVNTDDVATANSLLMTNKADVIVSAQPSLTKIMKNASNNGATIHTLDLQKEWEVMTGRSSYPQASIFVKASLKGKINNVLNQLTDSVNKTISDPKTTAINACNMYESFNTLGASIIEEAIPNAHYGIFENQKDSIEFYFNKMNELGLSKLYGDKLPDEGFYYNI